MVTRTLVATPDPDEPQPTGVTQQPAAHITFTMAGGTATEVGGHLCIPSVQTTWTTRGSATRSS